MRGTGRTAKPGEPKQKTSCKKSLSLPIEPIRKLLLEASERLGLISNRSFIFPARKTARSHGTYVRARKEMHWDIPSFQNNGLGAQAGAHRCDLP